MGLTNRKLIQKKMNNIEGIYNKTFAFKSKNQSFTKYSICSTEKLNSEIIMNMMPMTIFQFKKKPL